MRRLRRIALITIALALAGYIIWDRVEAYRLRRTIAALAERGEPVGSAAAEAPGPKTNEELEAARLYIEAVERAGDLLRRDGRLTQVDFDSVVPTHVTPQQVAEMFPFDAPAMQLIDRAATLPFAGFGDLTPEGYSENQSPFQVLSGLAALRADLLSLRGEGDAASDSLVVALRAMRTLRSPWYLSFAGSRVFGSLRILLRHATPSDAALVRLQRAFEELPDEDGLADAVRASRARLINDIDDRSYYGLGLILQTVLHPVMTRLSRRQIEQFDPVLAAVQEPWPAKIEKLRGMAAADAYVSGQATGATAGNIVRYGPPNMALMSAGYVQAGLNLVRRRAGIAITAIERSRRAHGGAPPPSLDSLTPSYLTAVPVDPFSGRPLIYTVASGALAVYSVDTNLKDDGGLLYGHGSVTPSAANMRPARDYGIRVPLK